MLDAVMSGDRLIGIVQPANGDGAEDDESPPGPVGLRNVGCVGRVTSYQEVDHARRMITLTGVMRYDILDEARTDVPYRVMSVSYDRYAGLDEGLGEEQVDRTNCCACCAPSRRQQAERPIGPRSSAPPASSSSTRCA